GQIKKACTRSTDSTIELAGVVAADKRQSLSHYGQWKQICQSLPFSRRKADMLATIGEKFATLGEAALEHLPSASTTLYYLAKLDGATFEKLLHAGTIHCGLKLSEARELWAKLNGQPQRSPKINVKLRLKRFADFVRSTASEWETGERELAADELTRL